MVAEDPLRKNPTRSLLDDRSKKKVRLRKENNDPLSANASLTMRGNHSFKEALMQSESDGFLLEGNLLLDEEMENGNELNDNSEMENTDGVDELLDDFWVEMVITLELALLDGPWMIQRHYLMVRPWSPNYVQGSKNLPAVATWVRFLGMPLHLYHKSILQQIGSILGRLLKIDYNTRQEKRGKFEQIPVELDLTKPLIPKFYIKGRMQMVEYEGLPRVCFSCGVYRHV
ncbi:protein of unknown function DUF4283 - like 2 [Theobroma cacao]|nr:protein of unknown function DUF4283 - like 2 [Theobroma cacao]